MADIGLDSTDSQLAALAVAAERVRNGGHLGQVANLSCRAMHLNVGDIGSIGTRFPQNLLEELRLCMMIRMRDRGGVSRVVPARARNDTEDIVISSDSIL